MVSELIQVGVCGALLCGYVIWLTGTPGRILDGTPIAVTDESITLSQSRQARPNGVSSAVLFKGKPKYLKVARQKLHLLGVIEYQQRGAHIEALAVGIKPVGLWSVFDFRKNIFKSNSLGSYRLLRHVVALLPYEGEAWRTASFGFGQNEWETEHGAQGQKLLCHLSHG